MDNRKIPTPFYAAAGAGDIAYRKLRELSDRLAESIRTADAEAPLRDRASQLRTRAEELRGKATERDLRAEVNRWMDAAQQKAMVAQEKAKSYYHDLVVHGERVVRGAEYTAAQSAGSVATQLEATAGQPKTGEVSGTEIAATGTTAVVTTPEAAAGTTTVTPAAEAPAPGSGSVTRVKRTRPATARKQAGA